MSESYILDAVRTPTGRYAGGLSGVRPDDLAAHALGTLVSRNDSLDPARIVDVIMGNANGAGEENRNVARMAVLLAGLPVEIPGATVNRLCGSGMEATIEASRAIVAGDGEIYVSGGVESMSRAPWVLPKPERAFPRGHAELASTTLGWRLVNPRMPDQWTVSLGEGAEILADEHRISREAQDEFAARSHRLAHEAWEAGAFDDEITLVPETELERDEGIRPDSSVEKLSALKPVFRPDGTVTAGNSSPLNDAAAAILLAGEAGAAELGIEPMARIASRAASGIEPQRYGLGPVEASARALKAAGIGWDDVGVVELNEAFAAQSLACLAHWPELDPELVNPHGGAIALGHPLGCSGARLLTTMAWDMRHRGLRWGLATMCIGVGQGIAVVLEGASG